MPAVVVVDITVFYADVILVISVGVVVVACFVGEIVIRVGSVISVGNVSYSADFPIWPEAKAHFLPIDCKTVGGRILSIDIKSGNEGKSMTKKKSSRKATLAAKNIQWEKAPNRI